MPNISLNWTFAPPFLSIILKSFHVVIIFKRRIECSGQEFINLHAYQYIPIDIDISELIAIRSEKVRSRNQVHVSITVNSARAFR